MNISAIIAEYNPLHNGHVYHIEETRKLTKADGIICVMSGNFVQRGEPAIIDKWLRTKLALLNGVDLVIELPAVYSISSAEFFSYGAVSLLNSLNIVDSLCFGSEIGNVNLLYNIAGIIGREPDQYTDILKKDIAAGIPFHKARSNALCQFIESNYKELYLDNNVEQIIKSSNNILAIEYCKSLIKLNSKITPYTVKRQGDSYNEENLNSTFSSATAIREHIKDKNTIELLEKFLPQSSYNMLMNLSKNNYDFPFKNKMLQFLKYKCTTNKNYLENIPDANEGLSNKIYKAVQEAKDYDELINNIKSKRYSYTRISRILCQYFIGFENYNTEALRKQSCPYAKILGFNETGIKILREIKENSDYPMYTKVPREKFGSEMLKLDVQATRAYSNINKSISLNDDYYSSPIRWI